jgi:hypothetical protein
MAEVGEKNEGEGARRHNHGWVFLFAPSSLAQFESPLRSLLRNGQFVIVYFLDVPVS